MKINTFISLLLLFLFALNLNAQKIDTYNGFWGPKYYVDDKQLDKSELEALLNSNPEAGSMWSKSKLHTGITYGALAAQLGFLFWYIQRNNDNENSVVPLIGTLTSGVVGIGFAFSATNLKNNAILEYNRGVKKSTSLILGPTYNGYGFVYSF